MTQAEKWNIIMPILLICALVFYVAISYRRYRQNKAALTAHPNAVIVSPSISRFLFSWFVYLLFFLVPISLFFWVIEPEHQMFWGYLIATPIGWLINAFPAYPYFALSIYDSRIEGGHLFAAPGRRIKFDFSRIDREKTLRRNLLHIFGIMPVHSLSGKRILAFGLDQLQVSQVLEMISNSNA